VLTGANVRGGMHTCVGPMSSSRVGYGGPSTDPVR
jgi:hypothetical protein